MWLYFSFLAMGSRAIYGVMTKSVVSKSNLSQFGGGFFVSAFGAIFAIFITIISGDFTVVFSWSLLLVIVAQGVGNILYFMAMKDLTSSSAQIIFSSILLFNTSLGMLFYGLSLTPINYVGVILLMAALALVLNKKIEGTYVAVSIMLLAALSFAVFQLASGPVSKESSLGVYIFISYFGGMLAPALYKTKLIYADVRLVFNQFKELRIPAYTAIFSTANFYFIYFAYKLAPQATKVAMIATGQVVFAVLLSYFFFKEKDHLLVKVIASILVVIAASLIRI
jgi:drug/metabolite transporter (DMT)-like permease